MVSAINYELRGIPLEVCGRMNAQTLRFRQLKVTSDLSNCCALPGHASLAYIYAVASVCIFHAHTIVRAEAHISTSGFNNDRLIYLWFALVV